MKILNWNIYQGGGKRVPRILGSLAAHDPDVAILTEFRTGQTGRDIQNELRTRGYSHSMVPDTAPRLNTVGVFSKFPLEPLNGLANVIPDFYERVACLRCKGINIIAMYFPQGHSRLDYLNWIAELAPTFLGSQTIISGDFNCGAISIDGFHGKYLKVKQRFSELPEAGWVDLWRTFYPNTQEFSWRYHQGNGFRIDHMFGSPSMMDRLESVRYSHQERKDRVSDHSVLFANFAPNQG